MLVKKKDTSMETLVPDPITKKDVYPLPRIIDVLNYLHRAKYFSLIDFRSGYWQIAVERVDGEKPAFVSPDGLTEQLAGWPLTRRLRQHLRLTVMAAISEVVSKLQILAGCLNRASAHFSCHFVPCSLYSQSVILYFAQSL